MACGCGGTAMSTGKYVWVRPDGFEEVYEDEIHAKAARIRGGGGGEVRPA